MANQHPNTEQLAGYLDAPESSTHSDVRHHLMGCNQCRVRIDRLTQLELDIKHYVPRFSPTHASNDNGQQRVERYLEQETKSPAGVGTEFQLSGDEKKNIETQLMTNPAALKAALHYSLHDATMRRDIDPAYPADESSQSATRTQNDGAIKRLFNSIQHALHKPMPMWAMAPASLLIAIAIGFALLAVDITRQSSARIATFQDDPTITFQHSGMPAGSIGFFHDAQARRKAFTGMTISAGTSADRLLFHWPPVANAKSYTLEVFTNTHDGKQQLATHSSDQTTVELSGLDLVDQQHYQWQLSGHTKDNMDFFTQGDFLYLN